MMDWSTIATVRDVFRMNGELRPAKTALIMADGRQCSFAEVNQRVLLLAAMLRSHGLAKGDRVAILAKNSIDYISFYGVSTAGFIPVPLNWRLSGAELAAVLDDCRPRVLLFDQMFQPTINQLQAALSFAPLAIALGAWEAPELDDLVTAMAESIEPGDTACLLYTSGTTGRPKGVELSHRGLIENCRTAIETLLHLTADDVTIAPMPFFHVGGMWYHLFPSYAAGCTTVILPEFSPQALLSLIQKHRVTNVHLVPTMLHALLRQPDLAQFDVSSLRLMFYAASSIPVDLLREVTGVFAHCGFVQGYGSTEAGMISYLSETDHRQAVEPGHAHLLLSCGRPFDNVAVRIEPLAEQSDDGVGEIVATSAMTMSRYWNNPHATQMAKPDGWVHTGDLGRRDKDGYLYIVDRKSDMIVSGGENVYPREVEEILFRHPDIIEAAVFDLPDPRWVQMVVAAVVLRQGSAETADGIVGYVKQRLASFKCPKHIFLTSSLPKNGAGKVLRRELRATYAGSN